MVVQTTLSEELVKECIEKLVPKMLFVNLMMCTEYDIIDTLNCYIDFVSVIERRNNYHEEEDMDHEEEDMDHEAFYHQILNHYTKVVNFLTKKEHIIYFRPCIEMLFNEDYTPRVDFEISRWLYTADKIYNSYDELSKGILATKYSFGTFL